MGSATSTQKEYNSLTPEEIVFSTSELLEHILSYALPKDLIEFRLVNSLWLREATTTLRKKAYLHSISLVALPWTENEFYFVLARKYKPIKLDQFANFIMIAKSPSFPPTAYTVLSNNFVRQQFFEFILILGNRITELSLQIFECLSPSVEEESIKFWASALERYLPNLEIFTPYNYDCSNNPFWGNANAPKLAMPNRRDEKEQEELMSKRLILATPVTKCGLKKLKVLNLSHFNIKHKLHQIFLEKVLDLAPSLEKIHVILEDNLISCLHFLDKTRLITLVKAFGYIEPLFNILTEGGVRLEKLKFFLDARQDLIELPRNVPALNQCLQISAFTLKKISIRSTVTSLDDFEFPSLPNLFELNIQIANDKKIFKNNTCNLTQLFPRLKKVKIEFGISFYDPTIRATNSMLSIPDALPQQVLFEEIQIIGTVTELTFSMEFSQDSYNISWLTYLGTMFPNLRILKIIVGSTKTLFEACPVVWGQVFQKLEQICLEFSAWDPPDHAFLDATFTGFDPQLCKMLFDIIQKEKKVPVFKTAEKLKSKRVRASILDLQKLKKIELSFPDSSLNSSFPHDCRISTISSAFAFEMINDLEVIISNHSQDQDKFLRRHLPTAKFVKCFEVAGQPRDDVRKNGAHRRTEFQEYNGLLAPCFVLEAITDQ